MIHFVLTQNNAESRVVRKQRIQYNLYLVILQEE